MEGLQKLKPLYLAKILLEKTDENHPMDRTEIQDALSAYGVKCERKTFYNDVKLLRYFGLDIIAEHDDKEVKYYIGNRRFELAELKILVDSVQSSRFITQKKTNSLIKKLESLVSEYEAKQLDRQVYVPGKIKHENETIYYNVDAIHTAINRKQRIQFQYYDWVVEQGKNLSERGQSRQRLRHEGRFYDVSPWALICNDQNYYLVGFDENLKELIHYRVDKMINLEGLNKPGTDSKKTEGFDINAYTNKLFGMYDGTEERVTLNVQQSLAAVLLDRFGNNTKASFCKDGSINLEVEVAVSDQFLGWVLALGNEVRIVSPKAAVKRMQQLLESRMKLYGK